MTSQIDRYARHAERFGTELVFETAAEFMPTVQLGRLSLRLQRIAPKWRVPVTSQPAFARELIDAGEPRDRACRMAQITPRTLRRAELPPNGQPIPDRGSNPLISRGEKRTNPVPLTKDPSELILHVAGPQNGLERVAQLDLFAETPRA